MTAIARPFAILLLTSISSAAWAAATPEQAAEVKAALETYFSATPGVVTVVPAGDDYTITIDTAPLFAKLEKPDFQVTFSPQVLTVRPKDDGTWSVSSTSPLNLSVKANDLFETKMDFKSSNWSGTYSPTLGGFLDSTGQFEGLTVVQDQTDPTTKLRSHAVTSIAKIEATSQATDVGNGVADASMTYTISGTSSNASAEGPPGTAPEALALMNTSSSTESATYTSTSKGLRLRALRDLLAWFVAHPSKEAIIASQAELKAKLGDALPVFEESAGNYAASKVSFVLPQGTFQFSDFAFNGKLNGLHKTGLLSEGFTFKGLRVNSAAIPPQFNEFIPADATFGFEVTSFDAETPVRTALAAVDLSKEKVLPPEIAQLILPALLPTGKVNVAITPSTIVSPLYTLSYDGAGVFGLDGSRSGTLNLKLAGYDTLFAKVQAMAQQDPSFNDTLKVLVAAKGMAKVDSDSSMSWAVQMAPDGKLTVNGVDMSQMMGGAAPPAP